MPSPNADCPYTKNQVDNVRSVLLWLYESTDDGELQRAASAARAALERYSNMPHYLDGVE